MIKITHKFLDYSIDLNTETLIIGTFNPATIENKADFFYSRGRNFLWRILPNIFGEVDLKKASPNEKQAFAIKHKIGFIDLIATAYVDEGQEKNYYDGYIDKKELEWRDVISEINRLKNLKRVCFTRKTFSDIPKMKSMIDQIQKHCTAKGILFSALSTPARFYSDEKLKEWAVFLLSDV